MENEIIKQIRSEATDIFKSSVEAVNPYHAVKRFVRVEGERLVVGTEDQATVELDLSGYDRILLVGEERQRPLWPRLWKSFLARGSTRG